MTTTTQTIVDHITDRPSEGDYRGLVERTAREVTDMNLPTWRFQLLGSNKVSDYFATQLGHLPPIRCTHFRVLCSANPMIVESECRFEADDGEYLWRAVDIIYTAGDAIVALTQYCSGCWDPATIA